MLFEFDPLNIVFGDNDVLKNDKKDVKIIHKCCARLYTNIRLSDYLYGITGAKITLTVIFPCILC